MENLPTTSRKPPAYRRPAINLNSTNDNSSQDATDGALFRAPMAPIQMTISPGNAATDDKLAAKLKRLELSRKKSIRPPAIDLNTPAKVDLEATERVFVDLPVENIPQTPSNRQFREPLRTPASRFLHPSSSFPLADTRDSLMSNATYVLTTPLIDRALHPHHHTNDPFTPSLATPSRRQQPPLTTAAASPLTYDDKLERQVVALSSWANVILDSASFVSEIDLGTSKQDASRKLQELLTRTSSKKGGAAAAAAEGQRPGSGGGGAGARYTEMCLRKKCLDYLKRADSVYQSTPVHGVLKAMVDRGEISVKPDVEVYANIGVQTSLLSLLFSLHPFWLFIVVETVCAELGDHDTPSLDARLPFSSSSFALSTVRFLHEQVLANAKLLAKKRVAIGTVKKIVTEKGRELLHKHCIGAILSMAVLLEDAKKSYLFENTPGLFVKNSEIKTVSDFCTELSRLVLSASGVPLNKAFDKASFRRAYRQSFLEEYQFAMHSVRDMADGIVLGRLIELLTDSTPLSIIGTMRNPQGDRLRKKGNVEKALAAAAEQGIDVTGLSVEQILAAHRESCLDLMWRLVGVYVRKRTEQEPLRRESLHLEGSTDVEEDEETTMLGAPLGGTAESAFAVYQQLALQFRVKLSSWADLEDGVLLSSIWQHYNPSAPDVRFYEGASLFEKVASAAASDLGIPLALTALRDERQLGLFAHMFLTRLISYKRLRDSEASDAESDASSVVSILWKDGGGVNLSEETERIARRRLDSTLAASAREEEERLMKEEEKRRQADLRKRFEEEEEERLASEWRSPPRSSESVEEEERMLLQDDGEAERMEQELRRAEEEQRAERERIEREEEEARLHAELIKREEEEQRKREEEARLEAERKQKEEEEERERLRVEEEERLRLAEEARLKAEEEERARKMEEEERVRKEEEEARLEEERKRREEEEERERLRIIEEARLKAEEEERVRAEEEERLRREEEEERIRWEEEQAQLRALEEEARQQAEREEAARVRRELEESAALTIQCWRRRELSQRVAQALWAKRAEDQERERRRAAAGRVITEWAAGRLAIRAAKRELEERRVERAEEEERLRAEHEARRMKEAVGKIELWYSSVLAMRAARRLLLVLREQKWRREEEARIERERLAEEERIRVAEEARRVQLMREEAAATTIQTGFRGWRLMKEAREELQGLREEKKMREEAARIEQKRLRKEEEERVERERLRREEEERLAREEEARLEQERLRREEEERRIREEEARLEQERLKKEEEERMEAERLRREEEEERQRREDEERRRREEEEARVERQRAAKEEEEKRLRDEEEARLEVERQLREQAEEEQRRADEEARLEGVRVERELRRRAAREEEIRQWEALQDEAREREESIYREMVAAQAREARLREIREGAAARKIQTTVRGWMEARRVEQRTAALLQRIGQATPGGEGGSEAGRRTTIGGFSDDSLQAGIRFLQRRQRKISLNLVRFSVLPQRKAAVRIQSWWRGVLCRRAHRVEIEQMRDRMEAWRAEACKALDGDADEHAIPVSRRLERARAFFLSCTRLYEVKVACYTTMSLCRLSSVYCQTAARLELPELLLNMFLVQADRSPAFQDVIEFGVQALEEMVKCSAIRAKMVSLRVDVVAAASHLMLAFYGHQLISSTAMRILRIYAEVLPAHYHKTAFDKMPKFYLKKGEEKFTKLPFTDARRIEFAALKQAMSAALD